MTRLSLILALIAFPLLSQTKGTVHVAAGLPVPPTLTSGQSYFIFSTMMTGLTLFGVGIWKCQGNFKRQIFRGGDGPSDGLIQSSHGPLTDASLYKGTIAARFVFAGFLLILTSTFGTLLFETPDPYNL